MRSYTTTTTTTTTTNNNNNNNFTQEDIDSAVYTAPAVCESSLWVVWTKVGQNQVAADSKAKLQT